MATSATSQGAIFPFIPRWILQNTPAQSRAGCNAGCAPLRPTCNASRLRGATRDVMPQCLHAVVAACWPAVPNASKPSASRAPRTAHSERARHRLPAGTSARRHNGSANQPCAWHARSLALPQQKVAASMFSSLALLRAQVSRPHVTVLPRQPLRHEMKATTHGKSKKVHARRVSRSVCRGLN